MTSIVEPLILLVAVGLFAGTAGRAVAIKDGPDWGDWFSAAYVLVFLVSPFVARAMSPTVRALDGKTFALCIALFYVFAGGALGYETGVREGERRSR